MCLVPGPGALNYRFKTGVLWIPAELCASFGGVGYECCAVSGAPRLDFGGNGVSGDTAADIDDFFDGVAIAVAEVEGAANAGLEGENVRLCEVFDVDVVAYTSTVTGFIIIAEDVDFFAFALCDLKNEGNEVAFRYVRFAVGFGGTAGVEIAEEDAFNAVDLLGPLEDFFTEEFGFAVDAFGVLRKGFVHWDFFGRSIGGTGGGENEFLAVGFNHGVHEVERSADVVFEERQGLFHRFAHFDVGGEVDDSFGLLGLKGGKDIFFVT